MPQNVGFRSWFYFRMGWSTYFAFIFAAINTLTVTYYLAIERYPALHNVFPTFLHYIVIVTSIGIPLLVLVGYSHYKKTKARKAEVDIGYETDPYRRRMLINTEMSLKLNLELTEMVMKLSMGKKLTEEELQRITKLHNELTENVGVRTFKNKKDIEFLKNITRSKDV